MCKIVIVCMSENKRWAEETRANRMIYPAVEAGGAPAAQKQAAGRTVFLNHQQKQPAWTTTQQMLYQGPAPNQTNKAQEATVSPVTLLKAAAPNSKTARFTGARLQISQFRQPDRSQVSRRGESTSPSRGHRPWYGARQLQLVNKVPGYHFTPLGRQKTPELSHRVTHRTHVFGFGFYQTRTDLQVHKAKQNLLTCSRSKLGQLKSQ